MENKSPEYNNLYKTYVLNFINRKVIPNEKIYKLFLLKMKDGMRIIKMIFYYSLHKYKIMNLF